MSAEDVEDAVDNVIASGELDGRYVEPAFRSVLMKVATGEITVDEAMKISGEGN